MTSAEASAPTAPLVGTGMLRGLRAATLAIAVVVLLGLYLPLVVEHRDLYRSLPLQAGAMGVLVAVAAMAAVLVLRSRPWGRLRWPLVGVVLLVAVVATAGVPPPHLAGPPHWMLGVAGWFLVLLLLDRPVGVLIAALVLHTALVLAVMAAVGQFDLASVSGLLVKSTVVLGFQLAVGAAGGAIARVAATATRIAAVREELRTADAVAHRVHQDRQRRYRNVVGSAVPLLAGLAEGRLDPGADEVRRACAVEAARLRRLFAESDENDDPLVHELRAAADVAERRGVAVHLAVGGTRGPLPLEVRRALIEPALEVVTAARSRARLTVLGTAGTVSVSAVADVEAHVPVIAPSVLVEVSAVSAGGTLFVEATWRP